MNHTTKHTHSNHLEGESSPYLLMHAHNPVDWYPWGQAAFDKATKENKPLIISIGYAACHWCHVMENESFEDPEVARIMNQYFVSVKVDREERPDIDQVYMNAVQLLTGSGGWPLNAVALPDGRPFYAGTYFPKEAWISILQQINGLYQNDPQKLVEQAERITRGIRSMDFIDFAAPGAGDAEPGFSPADMDRVFSHFEGLVDFQLGGHKGAPKFPMPIDFHFLLNYFYRSGNRKALEAVKVTLDRMAMGGIYDQVGGGFARYSTDSYWKVPHFEKMLYDNAQLVSLYSKAYQLTRDPLYKQVVFRTLEFIDRELTAPAYSAFYSSLDADSEGEEGKFYVWSLEEIETILGKEASLVLDYFNVTPGGNWEDRKNILFRTKSDEVFARDRGIGIEELRETVTRAGEKLLAARSKRTPPPLDDKILTAWNALMLTAYVDAYRAFDEESFLEKALANARFIITYMLAEDGRLNRVYNAGKPSSAINGFLDDYAFTMQAFISLYQATFDQQWLFRARELFEYVLAHFYDQEKGMFFYTSDIDPGLIARKMEITDNVIPASNSVIAVNLYLLGEYFSNSEYINLSRRMSANVKAGILRHGTHFANWAILMGYFVQPPYEVAIVGRECLEKRKELDRHYLPHIILSGGKTPGKLPLLEGKLVKDLTFIYVCKDKVCRKPVTRSEEALEQLNK